MSKLPGDWSPVNRKTLRRPMRRRKWLASCFSERGKIWLLTSPRTNATGRSQRRHHTSASPEPVKSVITSHAAIRAKPDQSEDSFPGARHGFAHIGAAALRAFFRQADL